MLNAVLIGGLVIFAASSLYFAVTRKAGSGLNTAFLVSFVTLISYVLMWQGEFIVTTQAGQPILVTRWLFYGLSCTLLMLEIGQLKGISGGRLVELLYLTAIVMGTGFLAARDTSAVRWVHFVISSIAYVLLIAKVLPAAGGRWTHSYIFFGWTVFPLVFLLAPTGLGLIGAALANLIYLALDIFTKIIFNVQLARAEA